MSEVQHSVLVWGFCCCPYIVCSSSSLCVIDTILWLQVVTQMIPHNE